MIVFVHQQLDGADRFCIRNAGLVRRILQDASNVVLVLQGHQHAGGYRRIEGIHYYTLKEMVDGSGETNSSYAIVEVFDNLDVAVTGYRRAVSKDLAA